MTQEIHFRNLEQFGFETLYDHYRRQHRCCTECGTVLTDDARFCPYCGITTKPDAAGK